MPGRRGLGGVARAAVRKWLSGLSEYHALKYGSAASEGVTLRDIVRMAHPQPADAAHAERFGWLTGSVVRDLLEHNFQIRAFESLKHATTEDEQVHLIREGRLPFEVVAPTLKATPAIWEELFHQAPYMNLLRNLVTFTRHGVFQKEEHVRSAVERLTRPEAVEHSKVLPFRFFSAWQKYTSTDGADSRIADALREALERSFVNVPSLGNRTIAFGTDVSGSMGGTFDPHGSTRYIDIAGIFTGALLRRAEGLVFPLPFNHAVVSCDLSSRDDILVTTSKISKLMTGGTALGAPIEHLLDRKIPVDVLIGITDNVEWAYGQDFACSASFLDLWRRYRKEVAPTARAYLVTIAPYRDAVAPSGETGVRFIYGWSDSVPSYIALDLEGGESQIQEIERMALASVEH